MKKGSKDKKAIKQLQKYLNKKGYKAGYADGIFGNKTKNALKDFQKDNNLKVDGKFGRQTARYIDKHCYDDVIESKNEIEKEAEEEIEQVEEKEETQTSNETENENTENPVETTEDSEIETQTENLTQEERVENLKEFLEKANSEKTIPQCTEDGIINEEIEEEEAVVEELLTQEILKQAFGLNVDKEIVDKFNELMPLYEIDNKYRISHFLSQLAHESGIRNIPEHHNYSKTRLLRQFGCGYKTVNGKRIKQWDKRKKTCKPGYKKRVNTLWKNPEKYVNSPNLFNLVYSKIIGNGSVESGDGFRYRGRGIIQLTGKANYRNFTKYYQRKTGKKVDFVKNPDLVLVPEYSVSSAFWYWHSRGVNKYAVDDREETIVVVTKKVNGGTNGLEDRKNKFYKIYNLIKDK
ncbi:hypothetical protein CSB11_01460 [Candidatus Campbellbacteria bacterium]|nr:MAG: hypothetical protein CSB11_01460 [Candidatus Campbellbacteria bacterium]